MKAVKYKFEYNDLKDLIFKCGAKEYEGSFPVTYFPNNIAELAKEILKMFNEEKSKL